MFNCIQSRFSVLGHLLLRDTSFQTGPLLHTHVVVCGKTVKESERNKKPRQWPGRVAGEKGKCPTVGHGFAWWVGGGVVSGRQPRFGSDSPGPSLLVRPPPQLLPLYGWLRLVCMFLGRGRPRRAALQSGRKGAQDDGCVGSAVPIPGVGSAACPEFSVAGAQERERAGRRAQGVN